MTVQTLNTAHFVITWDDARDPGGTNKQRANDMAGSCEGDYSQLMSLLGNPAIDFTGSKRVGIQFGLPRPPGWDSATNAANDTVTIYIDCDNKFAGALPLEMRALFVAELAEVVNFFWPSPGGFPRGISGSSNTEAISRAMEAELFPQIYYGHGAVRSAAVGNAWLNSLTTNAAGVLVRDDWITKTKATEAEFVSIGCATLFLFFLKYQLKKSWKQIMDAGGSTLATTYQKLTGNSNAWEAFNGLIEDHMPAASWGALSGSGLPTDNPFPLYPHESEGAVISRNAYVTVSTEYRHSRFQAENFGFALLKPCPWSHEARKYFYSHQVRDQLSTIALSYYGFALPEYSISARPVGQGAFQPLSSGSTLAFYVPVSIENPQSPGTYSVTPQSVSITGRRLDRSPDEYLPPVDHFTMVPGGVAGDFGIEVLVDVHERCIPGLVTKIDLVMSFSTFVLIMDQYRADRARCLAAMIVAASKYVEVPPYDMHPVPPEWPGWRDALQWLVKAREGFALHANRDPQEARRVATALAEQFGVPSTLLLD